MKKNYTEYLVSKNSFHPQQEPIEAKTKLNPGAYKVVVEPMTGRFWFEQITLNHDSIIDLPSGEYDLVVNEMRKFLDVETRSKYDKLGFLYKRSALLYGLPGTGKTVITNRVAKDVVKNDGIVLFVQTPGVLHLAYDALNSIQPETLVMVIMEEIDNIIYEHGETDLLNILDGEIQKQNVMYLATTNFIENIPQRIMRPGRFSSVIEVHYPTAEARKLYLQNKLGKEFKDIQTWVEKTNGLSIDELKEIVQAVYILGKGIDETISRLVSTRTLTFEELRQEKDLTDNSFLASIKRQKVKSNRLS